MCWLEPPPHPPPAHTSAGVGLVLWEGVIFSSWGEFKGAWALQVRCWGWGELGPG